MRFFKLTYFTSGEEYDYRERLLDEETFRKVKQAIAEGAEFLMFDDRVIKTKMVKEISPATKEVEEYLSQGHTLIGMGLKSSPRLESAKKELSPYEKMRAKVSDKMKLGYSDEINEALS